MIFYLKNHLLLNTFNKLKMTELMITRVSPIKLFDNSVAYVFELKNKLKDLDIPDHRFFYSPTRNQFANAFSFYKGTHKRFYPEPEHFPGSRDIWHNSFHDMLMRWRNWVLNEDEFSRMMVDLASHDQNLLYEIRPVLSDNYVEKTENTWAEAKNKYKL